MEAQLEEKNQELQRVSHCFSLPLPLSPPPPSFMLSLLSDLTQRHTNFLNPLFDCAHSDKNLCPPVRQHTCY